MPGTGSEAAPAGTGCNLSVLNWAGFSGAASYSFDDGQPSQIAHWPELKATGVPMTFYIYPSLSTLANYETTWKDAMASGCEIGNHSGTHKAISEYSGASASAIAQDIVQCSDYIENVLGQTTPCSFAYPNGDLTWEPSLNGKFLFARTINSGTIKPLDGTKPLELPIYFAQAGQTESDFNPVLDQSASEKSWVIFMFHSLLPGDNWYAAVNCTSVVKSINHGVGNGNLWMDTVERVGAYWMAQKLFATIQPQGDATSKTWTWTLPQRFPQGQYLRVRVDGGTLSQGGVVLPWNAHGFYEIALDAGSLSWQQ